MFRPSPPAPPHPGAPGDRAPRASSPVHAAADAVHAPGRANADPVVSRRAVLRVGVVVTGFVYLYSVTGSAEMAPQRALVYADAAAGTFASPACAAGRVGGAEPSRLTTKGAAEARGLRPDPECWRAGGFLGAGGSRWMQLLQRLHLYPRGESRWRADGSWRW